MASASDVLLQRRVRASESLLGPDKESEKKVARRELDALNEEEREKANSKAYGLGGMTVGEIRAEHKARQKRVAELERIIKD